MLEQALHCWGVDFSIEEGSVLPGEGNAFFSARSVFFEQEDDGLEDAAMEDSNRLPSDEHLITFLGLSVVVLVAEVVLPLNEGLVGDQGVVLIVRDLKISEELEVLEWSEALILVELDDYLVNEAVAGEKEEEGLTVGQDVLTVEG